MNKNTISKVLMAAALGSLAVIGTAAIEDQTARAQGSATVGSLRGTIKDKSNGEDAPGATVVATSPALQGEQVVITDETGQYFITSLPPGIYTLTVYYNEATFSKGNVLVQVGKEAVVNINVDSGISAGKPKGEVIEISGSAPIVDQGSTKTGVTITDDFTRNIPTGRTFGAVVGGAAGAQGDFYGVSFSGATSLENTYIVEGINTTDTAFGEISSNLPNEFISETEVITGGYNAEFGRATGGIVNVVTKQGSNEFHGSVFGYYRPGAFVSDADLIRREGGAIDTATNLDYQTDMGAEVGGPIIRDKLWFHVGLNPSFQHSTTTRFVQSQRDEDQDGIPDTDADGFTVHDPVSSSDIPRAFQTYYFTGKINGAVDQNNQFQVSLFGNPSGRDDLLEHSSIVVRNPDQTRWHVDEGAYDVSAKWTSKLNKGKTQIDAVAGYHHGYRNEDTLNDSLGVQDTPWVYYNYERSLYDFRDFEGMSAIAKCQDSTDPSVDPYPEIVNCPVQNYAEGGLSFLEQRTNARTSGTVSVTHRVKALGGYHVFKAGIDGEFATYDATQRYTGAQRWQRSSDTASGAPGRWQLREFFQVVRNLGPDEDPDTVDLAEGEELCASDRAICAPTKAHIADTTNRSLGAFVQDSWQIRPNLTLNLGLRWEQQVGYIAADLQGDVSPEGEIVPERAFDLNDMIAPRVGFIYDPTREGKSKLFGHYGRFYENVPMDINVRAFGGEIINLNQYNFNRRTPSTSGYDPACDVDHTPGETTSMLVDRISQCQDRFHQAILGGGYEYVSPGLEGQRTDEIILGAEYEVIPDLTVGANYVHRTLPTVIEDISTDGGNNYLITNPGKSFDSEAESLQKKAETLMASSDPQDQALGELYSLRAEQMAYVDQFQKPIRAYDGLQLIARQRPTKHSLLLASYTYSKTRGNYPGLFSTETTQEDPNLTSLYDLPELMANRYGPLGHDRPHLFKLDGFYLFDLKQAGQITVGASWRTQSGIPHSALATHVIYGDRESFLLPRGAMPRSPVTNNMDVRLAYGYKLNKTTTLEGFINVFNLFDTQEELENDEQFTLDAAQPVIDGTVEDLNHVKSIDFATGQELNTTIKKVGNFGNTTKRISPRNVQIGFRLTF
jgi:hypothetical protein